MNILGVTPFDSALSALGLNIAQIISDFIFLQTPMGAVVFALGFLLSLIALMKEGSRSAIIKFFFIFLTVSLLLLPKTNEGSFVSAQEHYGQAVKKAKSIKDSIISYQEFPFLLSYINKGIDLGVIGFIHAIDQAMLGSQFLYDPFVDHRNSLNVGQSMALGIGDYKLKGLFSKFLSDFYLPTLGQLNPSQFISYWPGDSRIIQQYSSQANSSWDTLNKQLKDYLDKNQFMNKDVQRRMGAFTKSSESNIEVLFEKSLIEASLTQNKRLPLWQQVSQWIIMNYFIIYGALLLMLCAAYPFVVIGLYLRPRFIIIVNYLKMFLWVKSLLMCSAVSFYSSILFARVQNQGASPAWAWEQPYFCLFAAFLLTASPIVSFILIQEIGGNT